MAENDLPPVSWASVIIGFISFGFTLSTFFKVIAGNLATLHAAPSEAPFYLSNLKQELFEERLHLRRARRRIERNMRRCRRHGIAMSSWDSGPAIRLLEATVRRLCREFRDLERPFLTDRNDRGIGGNTPNARNEKMHPNGGESGSPGSPVNLNILEEGVRAREAEVWNDYIDAGFEHDYGTVTFYHRFAWLERKTRIMQLSHSLERLQVRRIGRETTDALNELKQLKGDLQDLKLIPDERGGGGGGGGGDHGGGSHGAIEKELYSSRSTDRRSSRHGRPGSRRRYGTGTNQYAGGSGGGRGGAHVRDRSLSVSDSSDSSEDGRGGGVSREKMERVHVRRTRYHVQ